MTIRPLPPTIHFFQLGLRFQMDRGLYITFKAAFFCVVGVVAALAADSAERRAAPAALADPSLSCENDIAAASCQLADLCDKQGACRHEA